MSDIFEHSFKRDLQRQLELLQHAVLKGNCSDWAEYKYLTGQICGIQFAIQAMIDARQKAGEE